MVETQLLVTCVREELAGAGGAWDAVRVRAVRVCA